MTAFLPVSAFQAALMLSSAFFRLAAAKTVTFACASAAGAAAQSTAARAADESGEPQSELSASEHVHSLPVDTASSFGRPESSLPDVSAQT